MESFHRCTHEEMEGATPQHIRRWFTARTGGTILLGLLLVLLMAARHLQLFYADGDIVHFASLEHWLESFLAGQWLMPGPPLWKTGLSISPLYYWLHLPVIGADNPVVGLHVHYFLLEVVAIGFWIGWGTRTGVDRELLWTSALLLALYFEPKGWVCENTVIATMVTAPLFVTTWVALQRDSARAMILPGILLGVCLQLHLSAFFLVPPVVLASLLGRPLRWKRTAVLCGCAAGAMVPGATATLLSPPGTWAIDVGMVPAVSVGGLPHSLLLSFLDPAAGLGLLLAVGIVVRRSEDGMKTAHARLAALWLALGYVVLGAAVFHMTDRMHDPVPTLSWLVEPGGRRYGILNPARAVLSAGVLVWLLAAGRDALGRILGRELGGRAWALPLVAGACVVLIATTLISASRSRQAWGAEVEAIRDDWNSHVWTPGAWTASPHAARIHARLLDGIGGLPRNASVRATGLAADELASHLTWAARARGEGGPADGGPKEAPADGPLRQTWLVPRLADLDISGVEGARHNDTFAVVPGCSATDLVVEHGPGEIAADLPPGGAGLALLYLRTAAEEPPGTPAITVGDRTLRPLSSRRVDERGEFTGWWLFDLSAVQLQAARVSWTVAKADRATAALAHLPAAARFEGSALVPWGSADERSEP